ncbi:hypothetical protein [Phytohalomonas tamaricis]|uniref:hypothetical protein n=1 Tax=Phytohalomonas tamaricis TaxID=2081032 RepID=UPI000D0B2D5F|nr:hypothetical protein [Phytohalomonas tamaricis]
MSRLVAALFILIVLASLSSCASVNDYAPSQTRHPIAGLGSYAASQILASPDLAHQDDIVLLVAPVRVDGALPVASDHFREVLTRALLSQENAPQVISWVPEQDGQMLGAHQWLLSAQLDASFAPLGLTDRTLYPYQLTLVLHRPGDEAPRWQTIIEGAFDSHSLDNS